MDRGAAAVKDFRTDAVPLEEPADETYTPPDDQDDGDEPEAGDIQ